MASVTLKGEIIAIFDSEIYGNFEKRVFWLQEQGPEYPSTWNLECHQGDCNMLDNFQVGDQVECQVNVKGRLFQYKDGRGDGVANTLKAWKIVPEGQQYGPRQQSTQQPRQQQPQQRQQQYSQPQQRQQPQQRSQPQYRQPAQQQQPQQRQPSQSQQQQNWQQSGQQQQEGPDDLPF